MSNNEFEKLCKKIVVDYYNEKIKKTDDFELTEDNAYIVWLCKILQNNKALVSTDVSVGRYYEITYNGDKEEVYVDAYKKCDNFVLKGE